MNAKAKRGAQVNLRELLSPEEFGEAKSNEIGSYNLYRTCCCGHLQSSTLHGIDKERVLAMSWALVSTPITDESGTLL